MADSPRTTILSRRNALAATGAAVAFATFSQSPARSSEEDPEARSWLAKWHNFIDAEAAHNQACIRLEEAETAAEAEYPSKQFRLPGVCWAVGPGGFGPQWDDRPLMPNVINLSVERSAARREIERYFDDILAPRGIKGHVAYDRGPFLEGGRTRRRQALDEFDAWNTACAEIDARHDVPALRTADEKTGVAMLEIEREIADGTSSSPAAIAVKLAYWHYTNFGDHEEYSDERAVVSALQGATSLAGLPAGYWKTPAERQPASA